MDLTYVHIPITKTEKLPDGSRLVWGPATTDSVDSDRQVIDAAFAERGLSLWFQTGANVREMHQRKAVGRGVELVKDGTAQWLKSKVVAPDTIKLIDEQVLRAYSVGINNARVEKGPGHPPGGTIVDGEFVEVSLVDRPANTDCKVAVVTKSDKGEAIFGDCVDASRYAKADKEPDDDADADDEFEVDDDDADADDHADKGTLSTGRRKKLPRGSFAIPEKAPGPGSYPCPDEAHARDALARVAQHGTPEEQARVRAYVRKHFPGIDVDGDKKSVAPYTLKRFHDYLCAAYSEKALAEHYPTVTGLGDVIEQRWFAKALSDVALVAIEEPRYAGELAKLSEAYGAVVGLSKADEADVMAAVGELRKMFTDAYPTVTCKPGSVTPGQFKRPFISSGRALMSPSGTPRIPSADNVIRPEDFRRGPLPEGHERPAPGNRPPHRPPGETVAKITYSYKKGKVVAHAGAVKATGGSEKKARKAVLRRIEKGRTFYTNSARAQARQMAEEVHDYLVAAHPDLCSMSAECSPQAREGSEVLDNRDSSTLRPAEVSTKAQVQKVVEKVVEARVAKLVEAGKKNRKRQAKLEKRNSALEAENAKLAQAADPSLNPPRSAKGLLQLSRPTAERQVDPAEVEKADEVAYLVKALDSTDASFRAGALQRLSEVLPSDELAKTLISR